MSRPNSIIHIVSSLDAVNFGIWNAAFFGSAYLEKKYRLKSACWVCREQQPGDPLPGIPVTYLNGGNISKKILKELAVLQGLDPQNTIFVSHGCWLKPSRAGYALSGLGFPWIHVPHGMIEPWSLRQGRLKKSLYYFFREKKYILSATRVRAVSRPEKRNLERRVQREIVLVENGVRLPDDVPAKDNPVTVFLFMARLHYKKGLLPLVRAWQKAMDGRTDNLLIIAGPDEGEAVKIKPFLSDNARYVGPVYGADKEDWLRKAHYYLLPSFSEGFPTSVLEAMSFCLIPLISEGCNFPEVFSEKLGYRAEPDERQLTDLLADLRERPFDAASSLRCRDYVANHYSEEVIGEEIHKLYISLQAG